jgi:hypothetical protein
MARIGAKGRVWAVDSIEVSRSHAVSVGEQGPPLPDEGYIHFVRMN